MLRNFHESGVSKRMHAQAGGSGGNATQEKLHMPQDHFEVLLKPPVAIAIQTVNIFQPMHTAWVQEACGSSRTQSHCVSSS